MVCIPCIIIPVLLFIWHKFIQPYVLRWWNPWLKKDDKGNVIKAGPEFPFECKGGVCPYVPGQKKQQSNDNDDSLSTETTTTATTSTTIESKKVN